MSAGTEGGLAVERLTEDGVGAIKVECATVPTLARIKTLGVVNAGDYRAIRGHAKAQAS